LQTPPLRALTQTITALATRTHLRIARGLISQHEAHGSSDAGAESIGVHLRIARGAISQHEAHGSSDAGAESMGAREFSPARLLEQPLHVPKLVQLIANRIQQTRLLITPGA